MYLLGTGVTTMDYGEAASVATFRLRHIRPYYYRLTWLFFGCELYSLLLVWTQVFLGNKLLDLPMFTTGFDLTFLEEEERNDYLVILFPRTVGCIFSFFGATGAIEKLNVLCSLPFNSPHEKLVLFLRLCTIIAAIILTTVFFYNLCLLFCRKTRIVQLKKHLFSPLNINGVIMSEKESMFRQFGEFLVLTVLFMNTDFNFRHTFVRNTSNQSELSV